MGTNLLNVAAQPPIRSLEKNDASRPEEGRRGAFVSRLLSELLDTYPAGQR